MIDELKGVLAELFVRELLFHHTELGTIRDNFEAKLAPEFWEVGELGTASNRKDVSSILHLY
jgi:hypothetical protein